MKGANVAVDQNDASHTVANLHCGMRGCVCCIMVITGHLCLLLGVIYIWRQPLLLIMLETLTPLPHSDFILETFAEVRDW